MQRNRQTVRVEIPFNPSHTPEHNLKLLRKKILEELDSGRLIRYRLQKSFVTTTQVLVASLEIMVESNHV